MVFGSLFVYVNREHQAALEQLCAVDGSPFSAPELCAELVSLAVGYLEVVTSCTEAAAADLLRLEETHHLWRALRALSSFQARMTCWLEDEGQALLSALRLSKKAFRRQVERHAVLAEALRVTVGSASKALGREERFGLLEGCTSAGMGTRLARLCEALRAELYARGRGQAEVAAAMALREHFARRPLEQLLDPCAAEGAGDDTFLAAGPAVPLLLAQLARDLVPCGARLVSSVALDTPELSDYCGLRSRTGTSVARVWWSEAFDAGERERPTSVCFERFVLDEATGRTRRQRALVPGGSQALKEFLVLGNDNGLNSHLVEGQRAPTAACVSLQHLFVSAAGDAMVTVDVGARFFAVRPDWPLFADCLLGSAEALSATEESVAFPNAVVSLRMAPGARAAKAVFMLKALQYQPDFSLHLVSVACCFGDEKRVPLRVSTDAAALAVRLGHLEEERKQHKKLRLGGRGHRPGL